MIAPKISLLNKITLDSLKESREQRIIQKFTDVAIEILGADFGFVWLKKNISRKFELAYTSKGTPFTPTTPRKTGMTRRVMHNRAPLLIERISKKSAFRSSAKKYLEGLASIPITYKNHIYGNMYICFKKTHEFSKADLTLCTSIGNNAAQALTINRLHRNLRDIKSTLDNTPQPKLIFDPKTRIISYYNKSLLDQTGLNKKFLRRAKFNDIIHPSAYKLMEQRLKHIIFAKVPSSVFETSLSAPKNRKLAAEILLQYVSMPGQNPHLLAIFTDLRERKKSEEQIKRAAFHDTLTGLPNRFLFTTRLNALLKRSAQKKRQFALIFLDLDRFKFVNDTLGHLAGDSLLQQIAQRLKKTIKRSDTLSRFGGDEFIILLTNLKAYKHAELVAKRIMKAFQAPFVLSPKQEVYINLSMGMSIFPKDGIDGATLLKNADNALYRAKQHAGNNYQHFHIDMATLEPNRLEIEKGLRKAITNDELRLDYQPIIDLKTGQVKSVEALIRWEHPIFGLISPAVFIPYAEESGTIVQLGEWVIAESCRQLKSWRKDKFNTSVSINISARELLQKDMIHKIQRLLRANMLFPTDITLELTETFLIKNMESSMEILTRIKKLGFKTSLDDFGTGYASLNYLKRLPINYIKIDGLFIEGCLKNPEDAGIIKAIIAMAEHMKIKVIAEGVENSSQAEFLRAQHCELAQGNYFSPPASALSITRLLNKRLPI